MKGQILILAVAATAVATAASAADSGAPAQGPMAQPKPPVATPADTSDSPNDRTDYDDTMFFKLRADIGIADYNTKLENADVLTLLGAIPSTATTTTGPTTTTQTNAFSNAHNVTGDFLSYRGFPHRTYGEGTLGLTASSSDAWYVDAYWRTALTNHKDTTATSFQYNQTATTYPGPTATGSPSQVDTFALTDNATSNTKFYRDQFAATIGRGFADHWSGYVAYRYSRMRSTSFFALNNTSSVDQFTNPNPALGTCTAATPISACAHIAFQIATPGENVISERVTTQGPALGVGYSQDFGEDHQHIIAFGLGAAYSWANVNQTYNNVAPVIVANSGQIAVPANGTLCAPAGCYTPRPYQGAAGIVDVNSSTHAIGFWGNASYQYYVRSNVALSLSGDAYRFSYSTPLQNRNGSVIGKLVETSLAGRVGLSYLF